MKKLVFLFSVITTFILVGCSGSDMYLGAWKATDNQGNKFDITFDKNKFDVKDTAGKLTTYNYSQNAVKISNGVKSYGIKLDDGRTYQILFPVVDNTKVAIISLESGEPLYTISRDNYITYDEIYKLQ